MSSQTSLLSDVNSESRLDFDKPVRWEYFTHQQKKLNSILYIATISYITPVILMSTDNLIKSYLNKLLAIALTCQKLILQAKIIDTEIIAITNWGPDNTCIDG